MENSVNFFSPKNLPEKSGVYIVFANEICLYVGSSINLNKRFISHNRKKEMAINGANIIKYEVCDKDDLASKESEAIYKHQPILNRLAGRPPSSNKRVKSSTLNGICLDDEIRPMLDKIQEHISHITGVSLSVSSVIRYLIIKEYKTSFSKTDLPDLS